MRKYSKPFAKQRQSCMEPDEYFFERQVPNH
jgi:hypothetical protein